MFYLFVAIFIINDGFAMLRHYWESAADLRQTLIDKLGKTRYQVIHSIIDLIAIVGMLVYFDFTKHIWIVGSIIGVMILWYIPIGLRKWLK